MKRLFNKKMFSANKFCMKICGILFLMLLTFITGLSQNLPGARKIIDAAQYSSLQAAVNAIPPEGGTVIIPPGIFEITEPIFVNHGDVCIKGSGTASHIINKNTNDEPAIVLASDISADASDTDPLWRIQISDLRITGNENSGDGILAKNINEIFLEGITVSNNGRDGIRLDNCYEDPRISSTVITYNKEVGLNLIGCHDIVVNGNQFEENRDALHCINGYNLTMTGNNLDDHLQHGVVIENTYGSVVSGNMFEECNGMAIILDRDCYGITLGSNVIAHNGGGIILKDAHGISVSANTFTINKKDAVYLGKECGRITVNGNNFSNSYIGEGKVKRSEKDLNAAGIRVDGGKNLLISGNLFSGIQPGKAFGIENQTDNIYFGNNMLIDVLSDHKNLPDSLNIGNIVVKN